jgi:hypothetical protein
MFSFALVGILHQTAPPKWSEPVAGLQARIDIERKGNKADSPKLVTYLSVRNVTKSLGTVDVYMSVGNLVLWLENKAGKKLDMTQSGVNGRNGFVPNPFWLQLPFDSSIRMRCDLTGYFPPPTSEFVIESESGLLSIPKGWKGEVYLAGNFIVNDPPNEARSQRWEGKMALPRILIFNGKKIVSD